MRRAIVKKTVKKMLTRKDLKSRGWTDSMIKKFLPEPDSAKPNPKYPSKAPMKLYAPRRVDTIEKTKDFVSSKKRSKRRKAAAKRGVKTKQAKIEKYLQQLTIEVPRFEEDELIEKACENYNARDRRHSDLCAANKHSDADFLDRITVNFLRHCWTKYENELAEIAGKVGAPEAYVTIKQMVLDEITEQYPWLAAECDRQLSRLYDEEMVTP